MLTLTSSRLARVTAKWRGFCPNTALHSTLDLLSMRVFNASSVSYQLAKCNGESDLFSVVAVTLGSVWERRKYRIRKTLSVFCLLYRQPLSFSARVRKKKSAKNNFDVSVQRRALSVNDVHHSQSSTRCANIKFVFAVFFFGFARQTLPKRRDCS